MNDLLQHLAELRLAVGVHRLVAMGIGAVGLGAIAYVAVSDPRGVLQRLARGYGETLDAWQKRAYSNVPGAQIAWTQLATVAFCIAGFALSSVRAFLYAIVLAVVLPPLYCKRQADKSAKTLDGQVHGFALALANTLKTTASVGDALWGTLAVIPPPIRYELEIALKQTRIGTSAEDALLRMAARARSTALDAVVSALLVGRQTGGDLPSILEQTAAALRETKRLEERTEVVAREGRQSVLIGAGSTMSIVVGLSFVAPQMMEPMITTPLGRAAMLGAALAFIAAIYIGFRISRIDV